MPEGSNVSFDGFPLKPGYSMSVRSRLYGRIFAGQFAHGTEKGHGLCHKDQGTIKF